MREREREREKKRKWNINRDKKAFFSSVFDVMFIDYDEC